ncbi:MAG: putative metalloprotease CJM1_0395 family protein [Kordiimonas sp.]
MTSGTILPSIGPPPPEFRRSFVPEHLRPKSLGQPAQEKPAPEPSVRPEQKTASNQNSETEREAPERQQNTNTVIALGGASAVTVQVQEVAAAQQEKNAISEKTDLREDQLTDEEKAEVQNLKERDREVRAHENAHASAGSGFTGTPNFEFATGPDGVRYAVGGHVDIDVSEVPDDPRATIAKMEVVQAAALAPARPSGQDRAVAAAAAAKIREASAELAKKEREEAAGETESASSSLPVSEAAQGTEASSSTAFGVSGVSEPGLTPQQPQQISINLVV